MKKQPVTKVAKTTNLTGVSAPTLVMKSGISERQIRQLVTEGKMPLQIGHGKYDEVECAWALAAYWREKAQSPAADPELAQLKKDQARAEAERAAIETMKAKGEVVLAEDVNGMWQDFLAQAMVLLQNANYIPHPARQRLSQQLLGIRVDGCADDISARRRGKAVKA